MRINFNHELSNETGNKQVLSDRSMNELSPHRRIETGSPEAQDEIAVDNQNEKTPHIQS